MVIGLVLISSVVSFASAATVLAFGGGWLAAVGIYFLAGFVTSIALMLRLIFAEMGRDDDDLTPIPTLAMESARDTGATTA